MPDLHPPVWTGDLGVQDLSWGDGDNGSEPGSRLNSSDTTLYLCRLCIGYVTDRKFRKPWQAWLMKGSGVSQIGGYDSKEEAQAALVTAVLAALEVDA